MAVTDRRLGVVGGTAIKAPCRVATTANITLSGTQTIDGISVVADDRVLVKDQSTASENGIYLCKATAWTRATDFDGTDDVEAGTLIFVRLGTVNAASFWQQTAVSPTIDTDSITFSLVLDIGVSGGVQAWDADLDAIAALGSTGFATRTASNTWAQRTITGTANEITVTNGDGVSGAPTLSLPTAMTLTGKTLTGGTLSLPTINIADNVFSILDNLDNTKIVQFQLSGLTTATTRTLTAPNSSGTLALIDVEDQAVTGGARITSKDLGTVSSGTLTPDPGDRPLQHYTNGGAHTLAPGSNTGSYILDITNNASAGTITTSGFTKVSGDSFTTTNGHKFRCGVSVGNAGSLLQVQALQ